MKKTIIALLALAGMAAATDYNYIPNSEWADNKNSWQDQDGNQWDSSGFVKDNTNGNKFTIGAGADAKSGNPVNTGGFSGATIVIAKGGKLSLESNDTLYNTEVDVYGTLVVNNNITASNGAVTFNVKEGASATFGSGSDTRLGNVTINIAEGATTTFQKDLKLNGTTINVNNNSINLAETWLDSNCGSMTFNLEETGHVTYKQFTHRIDTTAQNNWSGQLTLSANCTEGTLTPTNGVLTLFERELITFDKLSANDNSDIQSLLNHIGDGTDITLNGTALTEAETLDKNSLSSENAGSYKFVIEDNKLKVQYAAYKTIPEPTTATLSLLALAGLAARRRRK